MSPIRYQRALIVIFLCLYFLNGCAGVRQYPPVEKKLYSSQIPKNNVELIKNTILDNGYERISKDNYPYAGAIVTQFAREITAPRIKSRVQIMLNFKDTCIEEVSSKLGITKLKEERCPESPFYRNLGITISNLDRDDIPEINNEINRIEVILYNKLLEVAGKENVVRGNR